MQTASNVARLIKDSEEIAALQYAESTNYQYTRNNMRVMFGTKAQEHGTMGYIKEKIWCKLDIEYNCYIPLTTEEITEFFELFNTERADTKEIELSILSDIKIGLISREEMQEQISYNSISCFISAQRLYKAKYDFHPIKVPIYELSAYELTEEEIT